MLLIDRRVRGVAVAVTDRVRAESLLDDTAVYGLGDLGNVANCVYYK